MVRATTEATEVEKGGHMLLENRNFTGKLKPRQVQGPNESMGCLQESGFAGLLQSKSQNQTGLQDFQSTSVVHPFSQNSPTRGFLKDEAMALPWKMASQRCGGAEDKHKGGNKGVREHRAQPRQKAYLEAGDKILLSDHAPPSQENLTRCGKVLWGTSKSSLSELCGELTTESSWSSNSCVAV